VDPHVVLEPDVIVVDEEDEARLLDFNRIRFFALDPIGTRMLTRALRSDAGTVVRQVAHDFTAAEEHVRDDFDRLMRELHQHRLVRFRDPPRLRRAGPVPFPGPATTFGLLAAAWLCVRLLGWTGTLRRWRRWTLRDVSATPESAETDTDTRTAATIAAVDRAVRKAAARHPLNVACKERALVGWYLLNHRYGLPAVLVVGIKRFPFEVHVWVECRGTIVTDDRFRCDEYTVIARYA
jgi:hypothetical protein